METWNTRLTQARLAAKLNKSAFGRAVGVSQPTVTDWESREIKKIDGENLLKVCAVLGVTPKWLLTGRGEMKEGTISSPDEPGPDFIPITRVNLKVSAGITGFSVEHLNGNGQPVFFRRDWVEAHGYRAERLYALKVSGDSMEPNLWDGDLVVMNTDATTPKDGEVFVANYEGEVIIKRLRRDSGSWWLDSDNTRHKPKRCDEHAELLGRVIYKQSERI